MAVCIISASISLRKHHHPLISTLPTLPRKKKFLRTCRSSSEPNEVKAHPVGGTGEKAKDPIFGLAMAGSSQASTDLFRWFCVESGSSANPPVVLIHGFPSQAYSYRKVLPILSKNNHAIAFDWLGFGFSDKPQPKYGFDYTLKEYVESLESVISEFAKDKVTLVVQGFVEEMRRTLTDENWKVQTTVCWGERDRWLSFEGVEDFCKESNLQLITLPTAGHHVQEDCSEEVGNLIAGIMVTDAMIEPKKKRSFVCSCLPSAILLSAVFFIGSAFFVTDYKERFLGCNLYPVKAAKSKICENECRPDGTETLPRGIVSRTTDLEMRSLWGPPKKFPLTDFAIMLFHYDGNVDGWRDLKWSNSVIHVSAVNQTKWWFAKRFLHPDVVAQYDYIFLWDEDLGVENFHAGRYLSIIKEEGLQISQPAIDADKSEVHYKLTARETSSKVHRRAINLRGPGRRCYENSMEPPCTGFVEMMAPVFSRASWRCAWYMIQNDLVHAWGLDFQLGYCAQGNRTTNIGIVDSEYVIHLGLPTLGGSAGSKTNDEVGKQSSSNEKLPNAGGKTAASKLEQSEDRNAVRKESFIELDNFKNRWRKAVREDECWADPFQQQPPKQS
ncbi:UNVERIFIED_CONTAM: Haloalkane dehalogenase [Sesamum radiatum]|uniref:Haloalkane dehalogenase n=1 Tax=Sesamum radiatum TaxID=300843 RepID=A0AAW2W212_SESRA